MSTTTEPLAEATPDHAPARRRSLIRPERVKELSLIGLIVLSLLLFNLVIDNYLQGRFFNRIAIGVAITALLAAGEAVVIIARQVDLSVGSIVGVSAYVTGDALSTFPGMPAIVAVLLATAIGAMLGLFNGLLVAFAKVPAIVVTLGTLAIYRAVLTRFAGGTTIVTSDLPDWIVELPRTSLGSWGDFDLRLMFVIALSVAIVLQIVLSRFRSGRTLYAVGSNPEAARQAGLPQARITVVAFVVCGSLAGLAGFMFLGQFGTVNVTAGATFELAAIAAAVVGGVSIQGGSGTVLGAFLGAILIEILDLSLVRVPEVSEFWRDAVLGALILAAIILDVVVTKRYHRRRVGSRTSQTTGAMTSA